MKHRGSVVPVLILLVAAGTWAAANVPDGVKTLVRQRCAGCHKGKFPPKGLNLEPANLAAIVDAPSKEIPDARIVDSKAPETSYLLRKVRRETGIAGKPMPPGKALTAEEIGVLEAWIAGLT
jgi:mono/diheme cytochrome c family protein